MAEKGPKILVCTVGSWSSRNGSDTMASLVKDYDPSQLACLYIRADKSDSPVCSKYFHIVEQRVVKSILNRNVRTGEAFSVSQGENDTKEHEDEVRRYGVYKKIRTWWLILVREVLWKMGRWNSNELNVFLDEFRPDVVLFPIEGYIHFNRLTEYVINRCEPSRVLGYMWDDNFTYKQHPYSLGYKVHRFWLRKGVRRLIERCDTIFAICPKMKRELDAAFGIESLLLTKPVNSDSRLEECETHKPIRLLYTGKLNIGRDETVATIVEAIGKANEHERKVVLDIYTNTPLSAEMKKRIDVPGNGNLHGFIPQQEVLAEQRKADVLLFVEALSSKDLSARLSFSTKITDYLSNGKCIWAVGNDDLAPLEYLKEEDAAIVSTSKRGIVQSLQTLTENNIVIAEYARKAYECGIKKHNKQMIINRFHNAVDGVIEGWGVNS